MHMPLWLEKRLLGAVDRFYANRPQPFPGEERLRQCKIVSHRGDYDNREVFENTIPAFNKVKDRGIWGIELDIRWTRDLRPVVFHDASCERLFGSNLKISEMTLAELEARFPLIPPLEEAIQRYGKKMHLMVEIKEEPYPDTVRQNLVLKDMFSSLEPQSDFHFISLTPAMFQLIDFVPASAFLPVSRLNVRRLSKTALAESYGGITGHYLLLTNTILKRHRDRGQEVGTGFVTSRNCLFREIGRGVEWIFSENAIALQTIRDSAVAMPTRLRQAYGVVASAIMARRSLVAKAARPRVKPRGSLAEASARRNDSSY